MKISTHDFGPVNANFAIKAVADGRLKDILGYTTRPNDSSYFNHNPHSPIFRMDQTKVMDGTLCSVPSWDDNE